MKTRLNLPDTILETKRLILHPISRRYLYEIFQNFTPEIAEYLETQPTGDMNDTQVFIDVAQKKMNNGTEMQYVVILKDTHKFVGCAGLHHINTIPEPGLWLIKDVWGNGYGFEIVSGIKAFADKYLDYEYLYYQVVKQNHASKRIAEKLNGISHEIKFKKNSDGSKTNLVVGFHIYSS